MKTNSLRNQSSFNNRANRHIYYCLPIILVFSTLLSSCSNDLRTSATLIGYIDGELADNLYEDFNFTNQQPLPDRPVFIGEMEEISWNDALVDFTKRAFDDGYPIVLVEPSRADIIFIRQFLGLDDTDGIPDIDDEDALDFYGLVINHADAMSVLAIVDHPAVEIIDTVRNTYQDGRLVSTRAGLDYTRDSEDKQDAHIDMLNEWLDSEYFDWSEESFISSRNEIMASVAEVAGDKPLLLTDAYATEMTLGGSYGYEKGTEGHSDISANTYTIVNKIWSLYKDTAENTRLKDYVIVHQVATLNANNQVFGYNKSDKKLGYYAKSYLIDNYIEPYLGDQLGSNVSIEKTSIENQVGETLATNSWSWSLSGNISLKYSQEEGFGGEIGGSGGVQSSSSYSYSIKDVAQLNRTGSFTNVALEHVFKSPPLEYPLWTETPANMIVGLAKSTYVPEMIWVWRINSTLREKYPDGIPITTKFVPILEQSEAWRDWYFFGHHVDVNTWAFGEKDGYTKKMQVTWPLVPLNKGIVFEKDKPAPAFDYRWTDFTSYKNELEGVTFDSSLRGCSFAGCSLKRVVFKDLDMRDVSFAEANLAEVDFSGADLTSSNFYNAKLNNTKFKSATLKKANLSYVYAKGVDFTSADLTDANVSRDAFFENCNFSNATWSDGTSCGSDGKLCPKR